MIIVAAGATLLAGFAAAVFATSGAPLADPVLSRLDAMLFGFNRRDFVEWADWPSFKSAMIWVYDSIAITPPLLVVLLLLTGRMHDAWTVVVAMMLTLAACVTSLALFPAYGSPPYAYEFVDVLDGLRNGTLRRLDHSVMIRTSNLPEHARGRRRDPGLGLCAFGSLGGTASSAQHRDGRVGDRGWRPLSDGCSGGIGGGGGRGRRSKSVGALGGAPPPRVSTGSYGAPQSPPPFRPLSDTITPVTRALARRRKAGRRAPAHRSHPPRRGGCDRGSGGRE